MSKADIYFEEVYGKSCELIQEGKLDTFKYESEDGFISNMFIKRKINGFDLDKEYYDIATPYGYGGPIINELKGDKKRLLEEYDKEFSEYCRDNNIVSEFVRFHPIIENVKDFEDIYDTIFLRKTVGTNLKDNKDPFMDEFSRSTRKNIRRALKKGICYEIIEKPVELEKFIDIYYSTMDRNNAKDFYYFDHDYFQFLIDNMNDYILNINIYLEDTCISSGIYFVYEKFLHCHLSGTKSEYLKYSPAYILRYALMEWGVEHDMYYIHHGGGTTNDPEDGLFLFKKNFTKDTFFDFYIGKKIFNKEIYDLLVEKTNTKDSDFFPQYRA